MVIPLKDLTSVTGMKRFIAPTLRFIPQTGTGG
jgi:hypothetical protein